jgi:D-tyrosyl-tRNA(Tyr) deacylase
MKLILQRVQHASVVVDGKTVSSIGQGILTLLGIEKGDTEAQLEKAIQKLVGLRIFSDENGKMNLSLKDIQGSHLIVSQFTLLADCSKGNRPSFIDAEAPEKANALYEKALAFSKAQGVATQGGIFGADMKVTLLNDGPVTIPLVF